MIEQLYPIYWLILITNTISFIIAVDWWEWFQHNSRAIDFTGFCQNLILTVNILVLEIVLIVIGIWKLSTKI